MSNHDQFRRGRAASTRLTATGAGSANRNGSQEPESFALVQPRQTQSSARLDAVASLLAGGYLRHQMRIFAKTCSNISRLPGIPLDFSASQSATVELAADGESP